MEPRALIPLGLAVHLVLARAELAEVLRRARHDILEELERHPAEWLACRRDGKVSHCQASSTDTTTGHIHSWLSAEEKAVSKRQGQQRAQDQGNTKGAFLVVLKG